MLALVREAEQRGYQAVIIACFSDPGLDAAREATDLPVVGIQDAAMHLAAQLGYQFSVLTTMKHRTPHRVTIDILNESDGLAFAQYPTMRKCRAHCAVGGAIRACIPSEHYNGVFLGDELLALRAIVNPIG